MAERTGFEPAEAVNLARFPSVCLKPLDHLSKFVALYCRPIRIAKKCKIVNYYHNYFLFYFLLIVIIEIIQSKSF